MSLLPIAAFLLRFIGLQPSPWSMGPSIKYVSTFFWETGLKIREKMMTVMYKKVLSLGIGVSKISKKVLYGRPL